MEQAYRAAEISPRSVGLIECYATGTAVGDAVEVASTAQIFADADAIPVGSVKSNIGHAITASGAAGLLKVLGALRTGIRPAPLDVDEPLEELSATPSRPLLEAEDWPGPRARGDQRVRFRGQQRAPDRGGMDRR